MKRRDEAGFTLTEMMIVVAILGILTTLAVVYLTPKTKPVDVSNRFADLVREASREAVLYGTVRADVALGEGSKRRTKIVGSLAANGQPVFTLSRCVEQTGASCNWVTMRNYTVTTQVIGSSFARQVGSHAALAGVLVTDWTTFSLGCYPDGSCDPATLFFQSATGNAGNMDFQSRASVLPLGTALYIRNDWN